MATEKIKPEHRDALNRIIDVGDFVAVAHHNQLKLATVTKLNNKMIRIKEVKAPASKWHTGEHNVYSSQCVRVEGPDVTLYLLSAM